MALDKRFTPTGIEGLDSVLGGGFTRNSLIVLAGNPGTGKSVFSAQFLYRGAVDHNENGVYVSFSESRETFYENMRVFGFDFEGLEREGRFSYIDMITFKEEAVSPILSMIVEEINKIKAKRLVLDSYSALAQNFKDPADSRIFVHTVMGKIIRSMGCTTILIVEVPLGNETIGLGVEEFVADGVLRFLSTYLEERRFREIEIVKLRGAPIKEPKLVFTLEGGFNVFPPLKLKNFEKTCVFQPIPDPPNKYSTGSKSLDDVLGGGIPKGSTMLLEIDGKTSVDEYHLLLAPIVANFLAQGKSVIVVPSMGVDLLLIRRRAKEYGAEDLSNMVIFQSSQPFQSGQPEQFKDFPGVVAFKGEDWRENLNIFFNIMKQTVAKTGKPPLVLVGVDTLLAYYGEDESKEFLSIGATEARRAGAASIAIVKAGYRDLATKLSAVADIYLRLIREHGCLILYGVKPRTHLYAVEIDASMGYPLPKLTPIL